MNNSNFKVSVVSPIYNEEENAFDLITRLEATLKQYHDYEIILVDDGSSDQSVPIISIEAEKNKRIKLICLSRNFGHQEAISAGLSYATGDAVIVMDGDLQDPPEVLPKFISKWSEGYDVVYAIRAKRKENIFKKMAYFTFYRCLRMMSSFEIPLDSGDFGLMDKRVVKILNNMPEKNKFVRGVRTWIGFKQTGLQYERDARAAGTPKFTLKKLILLALDGVTSTTTTPLKMTSWIGGFFTIISAVSILFVTYRYFFTNKVEVQGWASSMILILFLFGVQFLMMGIQGQYLGRIFNEVKSRPQFIVSKTQNIDMSNSLANNKDNVISFEKNQKVA